MVDQIRILPQEYSRIIGRDAQRINILAARLVAEAVRTTLGPKGMDKMLVDSLGDIVITNDGVTILEEMEIQHPAAKMMVEVAKTQEQEVGDGTTTAVVLAGEFLKHAEELLDQNIHPTIICRGFRLAEKEAENILRSIAVKIDVKDRNTLKKIVSTVITGKSAETALNKLADVVVDAVLSVMREEAGRIVINKDDIKLVKKAGGSTEDTELIKGIVLDKEKVHPNMPDRVENAKVLLLDEALEVKEPEIDTKFQLTSPDQIEEVLRREEEMIRKKVEKIKELGANVVFCQKGIDDMAQYYLAKAGILAVRRVKKSDMERLSKATGAKIVTSLEDAKPNVIGHAELVEQKKVGDENMIFVISKDPKSVTILIRGGTEHVVDETERAIEDAVGALISVIKDGYVVAGGGAVEMELANKLDEIAEERYSGKEQLVIKSFAKSLEIIPKTLAENAGLDAVEIVAKLRSEHQKGNKWAGVDVFEGKVVDMFEKGVIEPLMVKLQAIKSATEAAIMILRIDDVIAATKLEKGKGEESKFGEGGEFSE